MSIMTEFLGKFYLVPETEENKDKSITTVYLNFGWNNIGNQSFPLYSKMILENVCTELQYKKLCDDITTYLNSHGISYYFGIIAVGLICFIVPLCILYCQMEAINRDLRNIINKHAKEWTNCTLSMELIEAGNYKVTNLQDGVGYLEDGTVMTRLEMTGTGSHKVPTGGREASWPPLGYNIIIKINDGSALRQKWPKLAIGQTHVMEREIAISNEYEKPLIKPNPR